MKSTLKKIKLLDGQFKVNLKKKKKLDKTPCYSYGQISWELKEVQKLPILTGAQ